VPSDFNSACPLFALTFSRWSSVLRRRGFEVDTLQADWTPEALGIEKNGDGRTFNPRAYHQQRSLSDAAWLGLSTMRKLTRVIAAMPVLRPVPGLGCPI